MSKKAGSERQELRMALLHLSQGAKPGDSPEDVITRAKKYEAYLDDPNPPDSGPGVTTQDDPPPPDSGPG